MKNEHDQEYVAFNKSIGKQIVSMRIDPEFNYDGGLLIQFSDGAKIVLYDNGRSCCESRYMHTDDNLDCFVGAILKGGSIREAEEDRTKWGEVKESQFLIIETSLGEITVVTYNEHNGWYGGFNLICEESNEKSD